MSAAGTVELAARPHRRLEEEGERDRPPPLAALGFTYRDLGTLVAAALIALPLLFMNGDDGRPNLLSIVAVFAAPFGVYIAAVFRLPLEDDLKPLSSTTL